MRGSTFEYSYRTDEKGISSSLSGMVTYMQPRGAFEPPVVQLVLWRRLALALHPGHGAFFTALGLRV